VDSLVLFPLRIELPIINVLVLWSFGFGTFVALPFSVWQWLETEFFSIFL
jgi:hypothetical protein